MRPLFQDHTFEWITVFLFNLSGSSPLTAIKYQIMIMLAIFAGTVLSVYLGIKLSKLTVFNENDVFGDSILKK